MALKELARENLTVSTSAVGVTSTLLEESTGVPHDIIRMVVAHISGGNFYHSRVGDPADDGSDGAIPEFSALSPKFIINGIADIKSWKAIKASGASDAELAISLEGVSP